MSLQSQFQARGLPIKCILTATRSYDFWGYLGLGRLCDQLWQPPPFLHLTNRNLPAFAPGACQPSSWQGADGWQTTSSSGNVTPFSSSARVCLGCFPDFYLPTAQQCAVNVFSSVYPFPLIDPISFKYITSKHFIIFFCFLLLYLLTLHATGPSFYC